MPENDLESRLTRLEHEVARLREDVASVHALADRDVAGLRTELRRVCGEVPRQHGE